MSVTTCVCVCVYVCVLCVWWNKYTLMSLSYEMGRPKQHTIIILLTDTHPYGDHTRSCWQKLWLSRPSSPGSLCATDSSCWSDLPLPDEEQDFGSSVEFAITTLFSSSFFFFFFFLSVRLRMSSGGLHLSGQLPGQFCWYKKGSSC